MRVCVCKCVCVKEKAEQRDSVNVIVNWCIIPSRVDDIEAGN